MGPAGGGWLGLGVRCPRRVRQQEGAARAMLGAGALGQGLPGGHVGSQGTLAGAAIPHTPLPDSHAAVRRRSLCSSCGPAEVRAGAARGRWPSLGPVEGSWAQSNRGTPPFALQLCEDCASPFRTPPEAFLKTPDTSEDL